MYPLKFRLGLGLLLILMLPLGKAGAYTTDQPAELVIGQPDLTDNTANYGGVGVLPNTLNQPSQVFWDGSKLFVADRSNHRVLIFNSIPTSNFASTNLEIGQPNLTIGNPNQGVSYPDAFTLSQPSGIFSTGTKLFITDIDNNRVLIFNSLPTANNASANLVIGQSNMASGSANQGASVSGTTLYGPRGVYTDGTHLFIADTMNHRVLIYNSFPSYNNFPADVVVGQVNMTSNLANQGAANPSANTLNQPQQLFVDSGKLFISDSVNNRVLIYNSIPAANGASADIVIGQTSMSLGNINQGLAAPSQNTLYYPKGISVDNSMLYLADSANNRMLIYNSVPAANNAAADIVLGQPNMTSGASNNGGLSASTLYSSYGLQVVGSQLLLADWYNNRILIYRNPTPTATPTSTSSATPNGTPTFTATGTPTLSATPTITPVYSATDTSTYTVTPSITNTPSFSPTSSPTFSATPTISATPTNSPVFSATGTSSCTSTIIPTGTVTLTSTPTPTFSVTCTVSPTPTQHLVLVAPGEVFTYPSPGRGNALWFYYSVNGPTAVKIIIYNLAGEKVKELNDSQSGNNPCRTLWDIHNTAGGVYLYRVHIEGPAGVQESAVKKLAIAR